MATSFTETRFGQTGFSYFTKGLEGIDFGTKTVSGVPGDTIIRGFYKSPLFKKQEVFAKYFSSKTFSVRKIRKASREKLYMEIHVSHVNPNADDFLKTLALVKNNARFNDLFRIPRFTEKKFSTFVDLSFGFLFTDLTDMNRYEFEPTDDMVGNDEKIKGYSVFDEFSLYDTGNKNQPNDPALQDLLNRPETELTDLFTQYVIGLTLDMSTMTMKVVAHCGDETFDLTNLVNQYTGEKTDVLFFCQAGQMHSEFLSYLYSDTGNFQPMIDALFRYFRNAGTKIQFVDHRENMKFFPREELTKAISESAFSTIISTRLVIPDFNQRKTSLVAQKSVVLSSVRFSEDTGLSRTDLATKVAKQKITGKLTLPLEETSNGSEELTMSLDGGFTFPHKITIFDPQTKMSFISPEVELKESNSIVFRITDKFKTTYDTEQIPYLFLAEPPPQKITTLSLSNDTGASDADFLTKEQMQTITAVLSDILAPHDILEGSVDGGNHWIPIDTRTSVNGKLINWYIGLREGTDEICFRITDIAGNVGEPTGRKQYTLKSTIPNYDIVINRICDDTQGTAIDPIDLLGKTANEADPYDFVTKNADNFVIASINRTLDPTDRIEGSVDGGLTWVDITGSLSTKLLTVNDPPPVHRRYFQNMDFDFSTSAFLSNTSPFSVGFSKTNELGLREIDFWKFMVMNVTGEKIDGVTYSQDKKNFWESKVYSVSPQLREFYLAKNEFNRHQGDIMPELVLTKGFALRDDPTQFVYKGLYDLPPPLNSTYDLFLGGKNIYDTEDSGNVEYWKKVTHARYIPISWKVKLVEGRNKLMLRVVDAFGNGCVAEKEYTLNTELPDVRIDFTITRKSNGSGIVESEYTKLLTKEANSDVPYLAESQALLYLNSEGTYLRAKYYDHDATAPNRLIENEFIDQKSFVFGLNTSTPTDRLSNFAGHPRLEGLQLTLSLSRELKPDERVFLGARKNPDDLFALSYTDTQSWKPQKPTQFNETLSLVDDLETGIPLLPPPPTRSVDPESLKEVRKQLKVENFDVWQPQDIAQIAEMSGKPLATDKVYLRNMAFPSTDNMMEATMFFDVTPFATGTLIRIPMEELAKKSWYQSAQTEMLRQYVLPHTVRGDLGVGLLVAGIVNTAGNVRAYTHRYEYRIKPKLMLPSDGSSLAIYDLESGIKHIADKDKYPDIITADILGKGAGYNTFFTGKLDNKIIITATQPLKNLAPFMKMSLRVGDSSDWIDITEFYNRLENGNRCDIPVTIPYSQELISLIPNQPENMNVAMVNVYCRLVDMESLVSTESMLMTIYSRQVPSVSFSKIEKSKTASTGLWNLFLETTRKLTKYETVVISVDGGLTWISPSKTSFSSELEKMWGEKFSLFRLSLLTDTRNDIAWLTKLTEEMLSIDIWFAVEDVEFGTRSAPFVLKPVKTIAPITVTPVCFTGLPSFYANEEDQVIEATVSRPLAVGEYIEVGIDGLFNFSPVDPTPRVSWTRIPSASYKMSTAGLKIAQPIKLVESTSYNQCKIVFRVGNQDYVDDDMGGWVNYYFSKFNPASVLGSYDTKSLVEFTVLEKTGNLVAYKKVDGKITKTNIKSNVKQICQDDFLFSAQRAFVLYGDGSLQHFDGDGTTTSNVSRVKKLIERNRTSKDTVGIFVSYYRIYAETESGEVWAGYGVHSNSNGIPYNSVAGMTKTEVVGPLKMAALSVWNNSTEFLLTESGDVYAKDEYANNSGPTFIGLSLSNTNYKKLNYPPIDYISTTWGITGSRNSFGIVLTTKTGEVLIHAANFTREHFKDLTPEETKIPQKLITPKKGDVFMAYSSVSPYNFTGKYTVPNDVTVKKAEYVPCYSGSYSTYDTSNGENATTFPERLVFQYTSKDKPKDPSHCSFDGACLFLWMSDGSLFVMMNSRSYRTDDVGTVSKPVYLKPSTQTRFVASGVKDVLYKGEFFYLKNDGTLWMFPSKGYVGYLQSGYRIESKPVLLATNIDSFVESSYHNYNQITYQYDINVLCATTDKKMVRFCITNFISSYFGMDFSFGTFYKLTGNFNRSSIATSALLTERQDDELSYDITTSNLGTVGSSSTTGNKIKKQTCFPFTDTNIYTVGDHPIVVIKSVMEDL